MHTITCRTLLGLPKFQSSIFASVIRLSEFITECQNTIARLLQREREHGSSRCGEGTTMATGEGLHNRQSRLIVKHPQQV